jgi:hypothetical protein
VLLKSRICEISRGARKLTRTTILIKKIKKSRMLENFFFLWKEKNHLTLCNYLIVLLTKNNGGMCLKIN